MPLFFILSCATYKCSKTVEEFKKKTFKSARHLLSAALITFLILTVIECFKDSSLVLNIGYWKGKLYTLIFASGVDTTFNGFHVSMIGIPWFFFALFCGRTIFDFLHLKTNDKSQLMIICFLVCMIGIFWGKLQWLPFSLDIALAIMPFFYFGYILKNVDITYSSAKKLVSWGIVWLITLYLTFPDYNNWTYLELATRRYNFFPICYLTAIAGTMFVCEFSIIFSRLGRIILPMILLGKNSLYMLCIHILDSEWAFLWNSEEQQFYIALKRTIVDLLIFILFMFVKTIIANLTQTHQSHFSIIQRNRQ